MGDGEGKARKKGKNTGGFGFSLCCARGVGGADTGLVGLAGLGSFPFFFFFFFFGDVRHWTGGWS